MLGRRIFFKSIPAGILDGHGHSDMVRCVHKNNTILSEQLSFSALSENLLYSKIPVPVFCGNDFGVGLYEPGEAVIR
jgi:hypothetical protein